MTIYVGIFIICELVLFPFRSVVFAAENHASPVSSVESQLIQLHELAQAFKDRKEFLKAKEVYARMLEEYPQSKDRQIIERKIQDLNIDIISSGITTPLTADYIVQPGDTLSKIAERFMTTADLIREANHLLKDMIYPGQVLIVLAVPFNVVVSKANNELILKSMNEVIKVYSVATGKGGATPAGQFTIKTRFKNPVWFKKGAQPIPADSPDNALGTRWLGLDKPQYGIHGTIQPSLIGTAVSHGCIRMRNEDVEELYKLLPMGTKVVIMD